MRSLECNKSNGGHSLIKHYDIINKYEMYYVVLNIIIGESIKIDSFNLGYGDKREFQCFCRS